MDLLRLQDPRIFKISKISIIFQDVDPFRKSLNPIPHYFQKIIYTTTFRICNLDRRDCSTPVISKISKDVAFQNIETYTNDMFKMDWYFLMFEILLHGISGTESQIWAKCESFRNAKNKIGNHL